ncbi:MAG: type II secretion system protein [Victivallaceae bacterium]|nr:type II secretion system protein [Victivallaceae bacterium]
MSESIEWSKEETMHPKTHFTLIELLVVIAIIAILAGMLMPALGKARMKARTITCTAKAKGLAQANAFYLGDFNDIILKDLYADSKTRDNGGAWSYLLYKDYLKSYKAFQCPEDVYAGTGKKPDLGDAYRSFCINREYYHDLTHGWDAQDPSKFKNKSFRVKNNPLFFICVNNATAKCKAETSNEVLLTVSYAQIDRDMHFTNIHYRPFGKGSSTTPAYWTGHSEGTNATMLDGSVRYFPEKEIVGQYYTDGSNPDRASKALWRPE